MSQGAVIVGTGFGVLTHLRAMRKVGIEVKALVGRDPERTRTRAERAGVDCALTSLDEALALPGVDLVSIATPPHSHVRHGHIVQNPEPHHPIKQPLRSSGVGYPPSGHGYRHRSRRALSSTATRAEL